MWLSGKSCPTGEVSQLQKPESENDRSRKQTMYKIANLDRSRTEGQRVVITRRWSRATHASRCAGRRRVHAARRAGKTCGSTSGAQTRRCASARSTQAREARRRARRESARSTRARGRAVAQCGRPSGPAFLFSLKAPRAPRSGRGAGAVAPGVAPRSTGRPPRSQGHLPDT